MLLVAMTGLNNVRQDITAERIMAARYDTYCFCMMYCNMRKGVLLEGLRLYLRLAAGGHSWCCQTTGLSHLG